MAAAPHEQPIPPDAIANENAVEILRAFVVNRSMSISMQRAFDDPAMWGLALVDMARHAARIYAKETTFTEKDALERICLAFGAELSHPTDLGTTTERKERGH